MRTLKDVSRSQRRRRTLTVVGAAACLGVVGLAFGAGLAGPSGTPPPAVEAPAATLLDPDERAALPEPLATDATATPGQGFAELVEAPVPEELEEAPVLEEPDADEPIAEEVAGADEPIAAGSLELPPGTLDPRLDTETAPPASAVQDAASAEQTAPAAERSGAQAEAPPEGTPCGASVCAEGLVCCNESCGTCVRPGETCSQYSCASRPNPSSQFCGTSTCDTNEVCCNPSCGTCVNPGETCDATPCSRDIQNPVSYMCGMATCNAGMVCCNPSCGICTPPNGSCSQESCD